ncbi:MAG: hypothetical protein JL50_11200 [Peptococcaceae bacterium BICA1-7]|nr:MAG: hypothetical protein JL50_11200 [Peptococcaceae bacterium BICA1-7]
MKRKIFVILLVFLAFSCSPAVAETSGVMFMDTENHWAMQDIEKCKSFNLMSGYPGNLFMPESYLSRAEALVVIGRSLGWESQAGDLSTEGIALPEDIWIGFKPYLLKAVNNQLIEKNDIGATKFNEPVTRIEVFTWLARAFNFSGNGANLTFVDMTGIPASKRDMLAGVIDAGIVKGNPGNLINPSGPLTRAEMAAIMARLIDHGKIVLTPNSQISDNSGALSGDKGYVINKYPDYFTVHLDFGSVVRFEVSDLSLSIDGVKTTYGSLQKGSPVELFKSGAKVTSVSIRNGDRKIFGNIRKVDLSSIIIRDEDGKITIYDIDKYTRLIDLNGAETDVDNIEKGMNAEIVLEQNYVAKEIKLKQNDQKEIQGKVENVDLTGSKKIRVLANEKRQEFYLSDNIAIAGDGNAAQLTDIERGMDVNVILDVNSKVTGIEIIDLSTVYGTLIKAETDGLDRITVRDRSGKDFNYFVEENAAVRVENQSIELEDLREGAGVKLTLGDNNQVIGIETVDVSSITGRVSAIKKSGNRWIILETVKGQEEYIYVDNVVTVKKGKLPLSFDYIKEGMQVDLDLNSIGKAEAVEIIEMQNITGTIANILAAGSKITLRDKSGKEDTYYLDKNVVVKEGGKSLRPYDLKNGEDVKVTFGNGNKVVTIEVIRLLTAEGEVDYIKNFGAAKIEIIKSGGSKEAYSLNKGTAVKEGNIARELNDIIKGMQVRITFNENGTVIEVNITGQKTAVGNVVLAPKWGDGKILIEKNNGQQEAYDIDNNVVVRDGETRRQLDYIYTDMRVALLLDRDNYVTAIDIIGLRKIQGKVIEITTGENDTIKIKESNGKETAYSVSNTVTASRSGFAKSFKDVGPGMNIELILDKDLHVTHVNIL